MHFFFLFEELFLMAVSQPKVCYVATYEVPVTTDGSCNSNDVYELQIVNRKSLFQRFKFDTPQSTVIMPFPKNLESLILRITVYKKPQHIIKTMYTAYNHQAYLLKIILKACLRNLFKRTYSGMFSITHHKIFKLWNER